MLVSKEIWGLKLVLLRRSNITKIRNLRNKYLYKGVIMKDYLVRTSVTIFENIQGVPSYICMM